MNHKNIGSIGSACASVAPQTEIQSFISAIDANLEIMDTEITAIFAKANGILGPQRDTKDGGATAVEESQLSPLGEELRRINRILNYRNAMLRQIIDRIAL